MFCHKCGATLPPNSFYCPYCGAKAPEPSQREVPTAPTITRPIPPPSTPQPTPPKPTVESQPFTKKASGVLLKPTKTFEHIGLIQDLKGSSLILLVQGIFLAISMLILFSKTEWVGELSWSNGIDTQVFIDSFTAFFSTAIPLAMILGVLVSWPFISAVYWVLARILGGSGSFKGTMTVYGYASIPHIFVALMAIIWTFLAPTRVVDLSNMTNITNISDLSALIPPYYMLNLILNQGLSLWSAALISLGLQYSHHLSRQRAFGIGIGIWAILLTANLVQTWMLL